MGIELVILGFIIGVCVGMGAFWLIWRRKVEQYTEIARNKIASETAVLLQKLAHGEEKADDLRKSVDAQNSENDILREKLRSEIERRSSAEEITKRIPELVSDREKKEQEINSLLKEKDQLQYDWRNEAARRSAAVALANRIPELTADLQATRVEIQSFQEERARLHTKIAELNNSLENEKKNASEKLAIIDEAQQKLLNAFKALSADALTRNNQLFLTLAEETFKNLQNTSTKDIDMRRKAIDEIVGPLSISLEKMEAVVRDIEKSRIEGFTAISEQLKAVATSQTALQNETGNLRKALRAPTVRGRWGEIQLKRVVEIAGMLNHCDFNEQSTVESDEGDKFRPDMIVRLPGKKVVVVDSKVPLEAYLDAMESADDAVKIEKLKLHAAQIRAQINLLSSKSYWAQFQETPEFVVLFLPGESIFSAALEQDPQLLEDAALDRVILATPTTLITLLKTVAYGWRQEMIAEQVQNISSLGRTLYERIFNLARYFDNLRKGLDHAVEAYNSAVGCLESRVLVTARRFKALGVGLDDEITTLEPIDTVLRQVDSPELSFDSDEQEAKTIALKDNA